MRTAHGDCPGFSLNWKSGEETGGEHVSLRQQVQWKESAHGAQVGLARGLTGGVLPGGAWQSSAHRDRRPSLAGLRH